MWYGDQLKNLEKRVLDCGAGGPLPPLGLFKEHGYEAVGIEIDDLRINDALKFSEKYQFDLKIIKGDMRNLPFSDASFSYVYSYNTIFHMSKNEIHQSIGEMKRVLKPGGLCFVNFLSKEDYRYQTGEYVSEDEFLEEEHGEMVLHSYHDINEAKKYFHSHQLEIIFMENRVRTIKVDKNYCKMSYIDVIVKK